MLYIPTGYVQDIPCLIVTNCYGIALRHFAVSITAVTDTYAQLDLTLVTAFVT